MQHHVICYSGGHSSALVAIEVARRYGTENLILVNHDINQRVEDPDVKRFKAEVADYIKVPITFVNMPGVEEFDQFDVVVRAGAFKVGSGTALCTDRLKTQPFHKWLESRFPEKNAVIYYGFDANEPQRIQRRSQFLGTIGFKTDFPLAYWPRTIQSTEEIGIKPPLTYGVFKHANCIGCLKAGMQHWYIVFCTRKDIWEKACWAEEEIGYSIINETTTLRSLEGRFALMQKAGVEPTEHTRHQTFWASARKAVREMPEVPPAMPCECVV